MALFTTQTKVPLSWDAPPPTEIVGDAYEFLIADGYKLDIGAGFNLTIKPEATEIQWTHTNKTTGSSDWPQRIITTTNYLDVGGEYNLLITDGFKLLLSGEGRNDTPWSNQSKNAPARY